MTIRTEQPLKHRPGVLVMTDADGRRFVRGDGQGFTGAEFMALGTVVEPASSRPPLSPEERAAVDAAEERRAEALALVDRAAEEKWEARDRALRAEKSAGEPISAADAQRIRHLRGAYDAAKAAWNEAREVESMARAEATDAALRAGHAARMRQLAAEQAGRPPAKDERTLADRLADLGRRAR